MGVPLVLPHTSLADPASSLRKLGSTKLISFRATVPRKAACLEIQGQSPLRFARAFLAISG